MTLRFGAMILSEFLYGKETIVLDVLSKWEHLLRSVHCMLQPNIVFYINFLVKVLGT